MWHLVNVCMLVVGGVYVVLSPVAPQTQWFAGHLVVLEQLSRFFEALVYVLGSLAIIKYLSKTV